MSEFSWLELGDNTEVVTESLFRLDCHFLVQKCHLQRSIAGTAEPEWLPAATVFCHLILVKSILLHTSLSYSCRSSLVSLLHSLKP